MALFKKKIDAHSQFAAFSRSGRVSFLKETKRTQESFLAPRASRTFSPRNCNILSIFKHVTSIQRYHTNELLYTIRSLVMVRNRLPARVVETEFFVVVFYLSAETCLKSRKSVENCQTCQSSGDALMERGINQGTPLLVARQFVSNNRTIPKSFTLIVDQQRPPASSAMPKEIPCLERL